MHINGDQVLFWYMSLDVDNSFNSALVNSGNTFQSSFNDLQNWTQNNGTSEVRMFSLVLVQLLLYGLPGVVIFFSYKCNP
jgi:hypothetical protein